MLPTQKIKKAACAMALGFCALSAWNCGESETKDNALTVSSETARIALRLEHSDTPLLDSLVLDCEGADTLHLVQDGSEAEFRLDLFPHERWKFSAKLYANGELMQIGEIEAKLEAGENTNLAIPMHAVAGFVYVEIPLGFGNPAGIASGTLTLSSGADVFEYPMAVEGSTAIFKSGVLPLGRDYGIRIELSNSDGIAIFSLSDTFRLDESSPVPELKINSLRARIALAIEIAADVNLGISLPLPASRRVAGTGDLVISEFLVNPVKSDSTQFDFIEIYNGSNDTIDVESCFIGKSTNPKESAAIEPLSILPREVLVLGNDTNPNTPEEYRHTELMPTFTKSNSSTAAAIVLHCDGEIIDSVYYGKLDSLHLSAVPLNGSTSTTKSSQFDLSGWDDRENPENWCLGAPSPGVASFCE